MNALDSQGIHSMNDYEKEILSLLNEHYNENVTSISYFQLPSDTYIGFIVDESFNKIRYVCIVPPVLGTRSGFISQQLFGFVSNLILANNNNLHSSLTDKPLVVINTKTSEMTDSERLSASCLKTIGVDFLSMFYKSQELFTIDSFDDFNNLLNTYRSRSQDFSIANNEIVFNTTRLKNLDSSLTNEPYYYAINAYPAVVLGHKASMAINVHAFEDWYKTTRNNKNVEAFYLFASKFVGSNTFSECKKFLTAICTKPFLLLAGISGTGKSRIVRELAFKSCPKYLQDKDGTTPGNYCMIEVKPNWHDSTELIGYYSNLSKGYQFKKFVKFLVKAKMFPDVPFFVCMDEMNLAPVEQYFAEILSVLETRTHPKNADTGETDMDVIKTGVLVDASYFRELVTVNNTRDSEGNGYVPNSNDRDVYMKLFSIDTENDIKAEVGGRHDLITEGLTLPDNVIIVGTVNMDDTTHQFSRKVIDRAMTIEMNGGKLMNMFGGSKDLEYLPEAEQQKWQSAFKQHYVTADEVLEDNPDKAEDIKIKLTERLEEINKALKGTPFEVSYRVLNELTIMVGVMLIDEPEAELDVIISRAIDRILLMKILPRIEGDSDMFALSSEYKKKHDIDAKYGNRLEWLKELAPDIHIAEGEGDDHQQTAKEKIQEMIDRLDNQEFTRFWP